MLQPDLLLARKAGEAKEGTVKVRLGKKDYLLPYENWGRLVRITNHPVNTNKFLVWRKMEGSGPDALHTLTVREASRVGDSLREGRGSRT